MMRRKFLVRGEIDESKVREILNPILLNVARSTHKVTFRTSLGVVEYFSMSLGSNAGMYAEAGVSDILRKITVWNRDSVAELEDMLQLNGLDLAEISKEGPKKVELKT